MKISPSEISRKCDELINSFTDGQNWMQDILPEELRGYPLIEIRRLKRDMKRLKLAALQRPSIAIFGASQMGKSYLVSNLVKPDIVPDLLIEDPKTGEHISFIKEMNPYGSKESTGTVTRFTTHDRADATKGYAVKLLSPKDLVCIIANGYYLDIEDHASAMSVEEIAKNLNEIAKRVGSNPTHIFQEDDFFEIKDYLYDALSLAGNVTINRLTEFDFWRKASEIAPFISLHDATELVSFLWGGQEFLNNLFTRLIEGLQAVDFSRNIFCDKTALTSNKETILDVERVRELYLPDASSSSFVNVLTDNEKKVPMDRRILAALTAEVELPLSDNPEINSKRQFLSYADVLDFPGARSREHVPESVFVSNSDEEKLQLFVRGKVAYLFDMYNQDYGISTLLYCMDDSNPEVQLLPKLLYRWIGNTIGSDKDERETRINEIKKIIDNNDLNISPLLVILTKFDKELAGKPSEELGKPNTHNGKWVARLEANFMDFMHRPVQDKWITDWTVEMPSFKHIFPIYDPQYPNPVYERDAQGRERKISENYVQKLTDMRTSFINSPSVRNHILHPEDTWDEIAPPGKTGMDLVINYLTPTCVPEIKMELIKGAVKELNRQAIQLLSDHYSPEDIEELVKKAKLNGAKTLFYLTKLTSDSYFGSLLEHLGIRENEAWTCFNDVVNKPALSNGSQGPSTETEMIVGKLPVSFTELLDSFGINARQEPDRLLEELQESLGVNKEDLIPIIEDTIGSSFDELFNKDKKQPEPAKDLAMVFVDRLIATWISKVKSVRARNLGIGREDPTLPVIIEELIKTRKRVNLRQELYHAVVEEVNNISVNSTLDIVAKISFQVLNKYVNSFGWEFIKESDRPKDKEGHNIFRTQTIDPNSIELRLDHKFPGEKLFRHWSIGAKEAFLKNVYHDNEIKDSNSLESNQELGKIIDTVKNINDAI